MQLKSVFSPLGDENSVNMILLATKTETILIENKEKRRIWQKRMGENVWYNKSFKQEFNQKPSYRI